MEKEMNYHRPVYIWLAIGLAMVFVQVVVGGITRLTDSGLSITDWSVIQGVIPPMNAEEWNEAFRLYQEHATKQFLTLHADMDLGEFKWIYFWEYVHRLWARLMGIVFIIPLVFFMLKKWIDKALGLRLMLIFGLAAAAGVFGWIMVASGLNDDTRTWVSAYKLITHLGIAMTLFTLIYWTMCYYQNRVDSRVGSLWNNERRLWVGLLFTQILLGGLMAGMRAGLLFPFYPLVQNMDIVQSALSGPVDLESVSDYESYVGVKAWVQIMHRLGALFVVGFLIGLIRKDRMNKALRYLFVAVLVQYVLGVLTVIKSVGSIPVTWGAIHQAAALVIIILTVRWIWYSERVLAA